MEVSDEEIVSLAVKTVSEAFKSGVVPLYVTYAHLLRKYIRLEYEMKQKLHTNKCQNEHQACDCQQNRLKTNSRLLSSSCVRDLRHPSENFFIDQSLYGIQLLYASYNLAGCRCKQCRRGGLTNKNRKIKLKTDDEELRKLQKNDSVWAVYKGSTICEVLFIGHRVDSDRSKVNGIVGATVCFPPDDKEYFVPLHYLRSIKSFKTRTQPTNAPDDSGLEGSSASIFYNQRRDTVVRAKRPSPPKSYFTQWNIGKSGEEKFANEQNNCLSILPNSSESRDSSKVNENLKITHRQKENPQGKYDLFVDGTSHERSKSNSFSHSIDKILNGYSCHTDQQNIPYARRKMSLQDSLLHCASHFTRTTRRSSTSNTRECSKLPQDIFRHSSTARGCVCRCQLATISSCLSCTNARECSYPLPDLCRRSSTTCDSAISLSSNVSSMRQHHCNYELSWYSKPLPVHTFCKRACRCGAHSCEHLCHCNSDCRVKCDNCFQHIQ